MTALLREAADNFTQLLAEHVKLARLEFAVDMRSMARRTFFMGICLAFVCVGYVLAMLGVAALTAGLGIAGRSLMVIGLMHVVGGVSGALLGSMHKQKKHFLELTAQELRSGVPTLSEDIRLMEKLPHGKEIVRVI